MAAEAVTEKAGPQDRRTNSRSLPVPAPVRTPGAGLTVSVLIPAYNAAEHLEAAVRSALAQSADDIEVIVVDDGSTDGTRDLALRLASEDSRIHVLGNAINMGVAASRNRAIAQASGEWVALLDADDSWLPERLERLLAFASDADVVCDDFLIVGSSQDGRRDRGPTSFLAWVNFDVRVPQRLTSVEFIRHNLGLMKPMLRRRFLEKHEIRYNSELRVAEDFYFFIELLLSGARWVQLPDAYYLYSLRSGSLSRNANDISQQHITSSAALLTNPAVRADRTLLMAVRRLNRRTRAGVAKSAVFALVRHGRFLTLARLLRAHPDYGVLTLELVAHNLRLRVLRRVRSPIHAVPARIFD